MRMLVRKVFGNPIAFLLRRAQEPPEEANLYAVPIENAAQARSGYELLRSKTNVNETVAPIYPEKVLRLEHLEAGLGLGQTGPFLRGNTDIIGDRAAGFLFFHNLRFALSAIL